MIAPWHTFKRARKKNALPVGGGARVEDVLFGREQRQAVGIKVDRRRAHDGKKKKKKFPDLLSLSLSSLGPDALLAEKSAAKARRFMQQQQNKKKSSNLERDPCRGAAHSQRGGDCDCKRRSLCRSG